MHAIKVGTTHYNPKLNTGGWGLERRYYNITTPRPHMTAGFPISGRLVGGGIIGKRAKNCMKSTKSTFTEKNRGEGGMGGINQIVQ